VNQNLALASLGNVVQDALGLAVRWLPTAFAGDLHKGFYCADRLIVVLNRLLGGVLYVTIHFWLTLLGI